MVKVVVFDAYGTLFDVHSISALADRGVRLWSGGHQVFAVAVNALHAAMKAVHAGTPSTALPGIAPADLFERLTRADAYRRDVRDFLGG